MEDINAIAVPSAYRSILQRVSTAKSGPMLVAHLNHLLGNGTPVHAALVEINYRGRLGLDMALKAAKETEERALLRSKAGPADAPPVSEPEIGLTTSEDVLDLTGGLGSPVQPGEIPPELQPPVLRAKRSPRKADSTETYIEAIKWVSENISRRALIESDAPSAIAWNMHQWAKRDNRNEAVFFKDLFTRMLPTKAQMEQMERFKDDGRALQVLDDAIAEFEAEEAARAKRSQGGTDGEVRAEAAEGDQGAGG